MTEDCDQVYSTVHMGWRSGTAVTCVMLHNKTLKEARNIANHFGYVPPVWYKPWTWCCRIWLIPVD